jgi:hypothetical protein
MGSLLLPPHMCVLGLAASEGTSGPKCVIDYLGQMWQAPFGPGARKLIWAKCVDALPHPDLVPQCQPH